MCQQNVRKYTRRNGSSRGSPLLSLGVATHNKNKEITQCLYSERTFSRSQAKEVCCRLRTKKQQYIIHLQLCFPQLLQASRPCRRNSITSKRREKEAGKPLPETDLRVVFIEPFMTSAAREKKKRGSGWVLKPLFAPIFLSFLPQFLTVN